MLRYNNQVGFSKPVDYFRPLSVDVSVEYELPKEVAPPPGSAPLLIIHPSAYYRTKPNAANPQGVLSPRGKQPSAAELSASTSSSSSSYFLRSSTHSSSHLNNLPTIHQSSVYSSNGSNPTSGGNKSSTRYSSASVIVANPRTRSSNVVGAVDSRPHRPNNCPYGKCDECSSGSGSKTSSGSSKKVSVLQQQQQSQDPFASLYNSLLLDRQNASRAAAAAAASNTAALSRSQLQQLHQQQHQQSQMLHRSVGTSITPTSSSISTSRNTSNNKRLRMSSQQQQQQHLIEMMSPAAMDLPLATDWYPRGTSTLVAPTINSSSTPSSSNVMNMSPESIYLNQRSALYKQHGSNGGSQGQSLLSGNGSNSSGSVGGNTNPIMISNYMLNSGGGSVSGITSNGIPSSINVRRGHHTLNALSSLYSSTTAASQSAQRFFKECPIPVEKGSGSDSGVCSENDSDISPPMAPYFNANSNNHPPATRARSILNQDLPSAGCYCCCCPSTSDNTIPSSTSRKSSFSSGGKTKGKGSRSSSSSIIGSSGSGGGGNHGNSSSGVSNYSGYMAGILQESQLGSMLISSADSPVTSARNSPMAMDSSPAPLRKWFLGPPIENQSNFGRWFQV